MKKPENNIRISFIVILLLGLSCTTTSVEQIPFEKSKWEIMQGLDYPYRPQMVDTLLYSDLLRKLPRSAILDSLGQPDRMHQNHLYYQIAQRRIGLWPLHTTTLVIKLNEDENVDWIKLHQ